MKVIRRVKGRGRTYLSPMKLTEEELKKIDSPEFTLERKDEPECGFEDVKDERIGLWERRWKPERKESQK